MYKLKLKNEENFQLSNDGNWFAYIKKDHPTLKIIDTRTWKDVFSFGIDLDASTDFLIQNNFDFSSDSQQFAFFQDRSSPPEEGEISPPSLHHIQVYQLDSISKTFQQRNQFKYEQSLFSLSFGFDKNTILAGMSDAPFDIELWDIKIGEKVKTLTGHNGQVTLLEDHTDSVSYTHLTLPTKA